MNLAVFVTLLRLILSPVFFVLAIIASTVSGGVNALVAALWVAFVIIEVSDILDGAIARGMGLVSDLGKLLDPFADVISRLTYFVVFVAAEVMPVWALLLIMYRELGITFLRMVMYRDGVALAARKGGKTKALVYGIAGGLGLLLFSYQHAGWFTSMGPAAASVAPYVYLVAVGLAWLSFADYLIVFARHRKSTTPPA